MSRVGRKPIKIPNGVDISVDSDNTVRIKGPKGELVQWVDPIIEVVRDGDELRVNRKSEVRRARSLHGLYRNLLANMITGVSEGFERKLEVIGVGYRAEQRGRAIILSLGYSHQIYFVPPEGVEVVAEPVGTKVYAEGTPNQYLTAIITVKGADKQQVGQVAAKIRSFKPPDVYKSKGIRYIEERVSLKAGKTGV
ncbi:50S ribosomal protein L6 [bacterium]|nr:50S ribosomal protein L6 [bacterium]